MKINDGILVSSAYIFGIPALYIVLTNYRKNDYIGFHGGQALVLWCIFFLIFFAQRFLVDLMWSINYIPWLQWVESFSLLVMGGYSLYCGYRGFMGRIFKVPH